jgi:hypothetical protein
LNARISCGLFALALTLSPLEGAAQPTAVVIPDASVCAGCRVEFRVVAQLDADGASLSGPPLVATSLVGGGYVLAEFPAHVARFSREGAFRSLLARRGQGPGEIEVAAGVVSVPGDSILLLDGVSTRALLLAPDGKLAREFTLPSNFESASILEWPARVAMSGRVRGTASRRAHLLDFSNDSVVVRESFWDPVDPRAGGGDVSPLPLLAAGRRGDVWAGDPLEYHITHWAPGGMAPRAFRRQPAWFSMRSAAWRGSPSVAPPPLLSALHMRNDGRLVTYLKRASPDWRTAWAPGTGGREVATSALSIQDLYEFVIEVLDVDRGRVVARATAPAGVISVLRNGQLLQYQESEDGSIVLRVLEPVLIER